jgi:putative protease
LAKVGKIIFKKNMAKKISPVGKITHIYSKIGVAIVKFSKPVAVGQTVRFKGNSTDFTQSIESMQYEHQQIKKAAKGQEVGIKVDEKVHEGDQIFLEA